MVVVRVFGGLGNQLFQYIFGVYLSKTFDIEVSYDIDHFSKSSLREFALEKFDIRLQKSTPDVNLKFYKFKSLTLNKLYNQLFLKKYFTDVNNIFKLKKNQLEGLAYFNGYWQKKYFYDSVKDIFTLELNEKYKRINFNIIETIKNDSFAVSVHIRRGDYLLKKNKFIFNNCSIKYFLNAEEVLLKQYGLNKINLYVFSDDIQWVKSNIHFKSNCIYMTQQKYDFVDLYLMSICKHNIISNSTFSWWAANINKYDKKIIITPAQWYTNKYSEKENIDMNDLLPTNWIKIYDNK